MIELKNERLTVKISKCGAELKSLCCDGTEYIWPSRLEIWGGFRSDNVSDLRRTKK